MTQFDKREEGFEKKFAIDEELRFKADARRNRLLGLWVAGKLGLSGDAAVAYGVHVPAPGGQAAAAADRQPRGRGRRARTRRNGGAGPLAPMIGREEELELLLRRWEQAKQGQGRVVLLSGEPGIGKSRLTASLPQHLSGQSYVRLQYFCSPHHRNTALYPVIGQLRRAAGLELDDFNLFVFACEVRHCTVRQDAENR